MKLTQSEIIQVLRKRFNMNQGTFGAKAFNTSFESGRTKVKNIELGKQKPTRQDLENMARVLGVAIEELIPERSPTQFPGYNGHTMMPRDDGGIHISRRVLDFFPDIEPYLDMLDKAATLNDHELINHLSERISEILRMQPVDKSASHSL
mgnify:CR=1 FL=1|jgi:transcriptional regulator with XRE-family HTH domain